jgi:hypothetical protein
VSHGWYLAGYDLSRHDWRSFQVFKVYGKALRVRQTLIFEDSNGRELLKIQERVARVRDTMEIEDPGGHTVATVKKALITPLRDRWTVKVADGPDRPRAEPRADAGRHSGLGPDGARGALALMPHRPKGPAGRYVLQPRWRNLTAADGSQLGRRGRASAGRPAEAGCRMRLSATRPVTRTTRTTRYPSLSWRSECPARRWIVSWESVRAWG